MTNNVAIPARFLSVLMCSTALGCGDDSTTSGGDGDAGGQANICFTEVEADNSGAQSIVYLCTADPSADADSDNACRNTSDCAIIDTDEVRELAKNCGLGARGMEADCDVYNEFNEGCVITETSNKLMAPGLSKACAACYAETVACGSHFCLAECAADADDPVCVDCQLRAGCRIPFERCSGLERK